MTIFVNIQNKKLLLLGGKACLDTPSFTSLGSQTCILTTAIVSLASSPIDRFFREVIPDHLQGMRLNKKTGPAMLEFKMETCRIRFSVERTWLNHHILHRQVYNLLFNLTNARFILPVCILLSTLVTPASMKKPPFCLSWK